MLAFKDPVITIHTQHYCGILWDLQTTISMLTRDLIMLHGSACPYVAHTVQDILHSMCWKVLDHPPYNPDLSRVTSMCLAPLKKVLMGHVFGSDEDVKAALVQWFQQQPRELCAEWICGLVLQWDACLSVHGTVSNDFFSFTQNSLWMCFIWTSLILCKAHFLCCWSYGFRLWIQFIFFSLPT
jgi:hypothetical protein